MPLCLHCFKCVTTVSKQRKHHCTKVAIFVMIATPCCSTPTFPVDTHIYRLAQRWGLTQGKTVEQAEADLKVLLPEDKWNNLHLRFIYFGREHCPAQRHDPTTCPICSWAAVPPHNMYGHFLSLCPVVVACACTCVLSALHCVVYCQQCVAVPCAVPGMCVIVLGMSLVSPGTEVA